MLDLAAGAAVDGRLAEDDGNLSEAIARYAAAIDTFAGYGWDMPANLVRAWLGRCLLVADDAEAGLGHLEAARRFAMHMGMAPWLAELDRLLAGVGEARPFPKPDASTSRVRCQ
jgi:hypothetical protein